jgi:hypothetical protein
MPTSREKYAYELVEESEKGIVRGLTVYGDFCKETETRNMIAEQEEEVVDAFTYNRFDGQMRPDRFKFQEKMNTLYLAVYMALREEKEYRAQEANP